MKPKDYSKVPWNILFKIYTQTESGISAVNSNRKVGWKNYKRNGKPSGWRVEFNGKAYYVHRVIWILLHGTIDDELVINHIDCNPFNNTHSNLELCTSQKNGRRNKCHAGIELRKENKSGYTGVSEHKTGNQFYAKAYWVNLEGKPNTKYFPYTLYGKELAVQKAVETRKSAIQLLNEQGAGYSEAT